MARPLLEMFSSSNELYQFEGGKMAMVVFCQKFCHFPSENVVGHNLGQKKV